MPARSHAMLVLSAFAPGPALELSGPGLGGPGAASAGPSVGKFTESRWRRVEFKLSLSRQHYSGLARAATVTPAVATRENLLVTVVNLPSSVFLWRRSV